MDNRLNPQVFKTLQGFITWRHPGVGVRPKRKGKEDVTIKGFKWVGQVLSDCSKNSQIINQQADRNWVVKL